MNYLKNIILLLILLIGKDSLAQSWLTFTKEELEYSGAIEDLKLDKNDGSVWITTDDKLVHLKSNGMHENFSYLDLADGLDIQNVRAIHPTDTAIIGLDALEGVFYIPFSSFDLLTVVDPTILSGQFLVEDANDTLWIGTKNNYDEGFFSFVDGEQFAEYSTSNCDIPNNTVYCILKDHSDRMWITHWNGTTGSGLTKIEGDVWSYMHHGNTSLPTPHIPNIIESNDGDIIACTKMGVCKYDEGADDWIVYNMENSNMPSEYATNGVFDSEGRLWVLFSETALAYTENLTDWTIFNAENSPLTFTAYDDFIAIDEFDNIWFGGNNRIHALNLNDFGGWLSVREETTNPNTIQVYPNPTNGLVTIQTDMDIQKIELFDLAGRKVISIDNDIQVIDLSQLTKGTYLIKVTDSNGQQELSKIVVN